MKHRVNKISSTEELNSLPTKKKKILMFNIEGLLRIS